MDFHPIAEIFPMMGEAELTALAEDIAEHGLLEPIIIHEDKILDGRNRYVACFMKEIEPEYEEYTGNNDDLLNYVISLNLKRRHLSESQRAMVAAKIANMPEGRPDLTVSIDTVKSLEQAAEMLSVGRASVARARTVQQDGLPELVKLVDENVLAVSAAAEIAQRPKEEQVALLKEVEEAGGIEETKKAAKMAAKKAQHAKRVERMASVNAIEGDRKGVRLIHGDMLEVVPTLGLFDLVVTDPPYGVVPKYDSTDPQEWDRFDDFLGECRQWLTVIKAALRPEYNLFWFCSPHYAAKIEAIFDDLGLPIQSRIIWHRRSLPKGRNAKARFLSTWDMILHAGTRELNFPAEWSDAWFDVQVFSQPLTSSRGIDKKIHETQKPSELIERLATFGSFPGDRVLDPFAGSGVLGSICPPDRICVLVEKGAEYVGRIEQRLSIRAECKTDSGQGTPLGR